MDLRNFMILSIPRFRGETYRQLINWDIEFPYIGKTNYVVTRKPNMENNGYVEFVYENSLEFFKNLKKKN